MKSGMIRTHLPELTAHVRKILKTRDFKVKHFAARMHISPQTASRLLRRNDWKVSELLSVGELLNINLFEFFTPKLFSEINEQRGRIALLEEELRKWQQEEEGKKQQLEIALLREMLGTKN